MKLTEKEFEDELSYLTSKHILNQLLDNNLINQEEYQKIKEALLRHYKPLISSLLEGQVNAR